MEKETLLSEVALGNIPPDKVITNGCLFNAFTREFIKHQSIWIKEDMIAYVGPDSHPPKSETTQIMDAEGMVLLPGLIDGHTHATGNRMSIEEFVRYLIPTGVTTVITETSEFGIIAGKSGLDCLIQWINNQPIRFFYTIAPLSGLIPDVEVNIPSIETYSDYLKDPNCLGVGEIYWGNLFLKGKQGERLKELISMALQMGKTAEGHTAGASGKKLQAYTDFGFSSCHEPITDDEVLERLRLGYCVMIREGSVRRELNGVKKIFKKNLDFRKLSLCTDGIDPEDMLTKGYLDASLKEVIKQGLLPGKAFQMVTLNVAEHFRIDHLVGSLSPGKKADIVIIPSAKEYSPRWVICDGNVIYQEGRTLFEPREASFPQEMFDTVHLGNYRIPPIPQKGKVRVIEMVTRLVTKEKIIDLEDPRDSKGVMMILALDRLGTGKGFMGFLKGFGLRKGAYGTTMSWDSPDMIVVGCDVQSIGTVIARLNENKGGGVYAVKSEVVAEFQAPLFGCISLKPLNIVRDECKKIENVLKINGVKWEKPMLTVDTLGSPAIPHLRISREGYVNLKDRKISGVEV